MAINKQAIFTTTSQRGIATVRLTTANTTRDLSVTANAMLLLSAPADGCCLSSITFTHSAASQTQASVACVGRVWICSSAAGANPRLLKEVELPLVTPSATAKGGTQTITLTPDEGFLKNGEHLWVGISASQTSGAYDVIANGGDYTS